MSEKELTEEQKDFLQKLSLGIQAGDFHWIDTALEMKEKTQLYYNWLKYVDGRGWTDIMAKPQEIKEKFDKLNAEIKQLTKDNGHNGIVIAARDIKINNLTEQLESTRAGVISHLEISVYNKEKVQKIKKFMEDHRYVLLEEGITELKKILEE